MKKGDIILVLVILLVAGSAFGIYTFLSGHDGGAVVIYVDGEEEGRYRLDKDRTVEINGGTNTLRIEDGSARDGNSPLSGSDLCPAQGDFAKRREYYLSALQDRGVDRRRGGYGCG